MKVRSTKSKKRLLECDIFKSNQSRKSEERIKASESLSVKSKKKPSSSRIECDIFKSSQNQMNKKKSQMKSQLQA